MVNCASSDMWHAILNYWFVIATLFFRRMGDNFARLRQYYTPATHYSSLFTNSDKTTFSRKKLFREKWRKGVYTLLVIDSSFHERFVESKIRRKKFFDFVKKLPTPANAFCEKVFHKTLTNMTNYSLHTIQGLHRFSLFVPFRHCSRIVCSGLYPRSKKTELRFFHPVVLLTRPIQH